MTDICFIDTETLGLDPYAPIWEFAAWRDNADGSSQFVTYFIDHDDAEEWLPDLPESFQQDYRARYDKSASFARDAAAEDIHHITKGAVIVGCNPGFDLDSQRLVALLEQNDVKPEWHYHPLDTASMALARLAAEGRLPAGPWKSDELSRLIGVDPADYPRHTAMGDVKWCRAQWRVLMGRGFGVSVQGGKQLRDTRITQALAALDDARTLVADLINEGADILGLAQAHLNHAVTELQHRRLP